MGLQGVGQRLWNKPPRTCPSALPTQHLPKPSCSLSRARRAGGHTQEMQVPGVKLVWGAPLLLRFFPFPVLHPPLSRLGPGGVSSEPSSSGPWCPLTTLLRDRSTHRPQQSSLDLCANLCTLPRCCIECTYVGNMLASPCVAAVVAHASAQAPGGTARAPVPSGPPAQASPWAPCPQLCPCFNRPEAAPDRGT